MSFFQTSVGKKLMMAVTGLFMLLFIVIHMIGNSTIYADWLNDYAAHLHALPPLVWCFRFFMCAVFCVHVYFGITLTLENRASRPAAYAVTKHIKAGFAGRNMIWTGLAITAFLIYHLLHFTAHVTNPEISAGILKDSLGRPDVYSMVVLSFQKIPVATAYLAAMCALYLHLSHGIQSFVQTFGLNSDRSLPVVVKTGSLAAIVLSLGYVLIPLAVLAGILRN